VSETAKWYRGVQWLRRDGTVVVDVRAHVPGPDWSEPVAVHEVREAFDKRVRLEDTCAAERFALYDALRKAAAL
jgi:hypothetical protein